jgi:hypothetical protein
MVETTENKEAALVLAGTIAAGATAFVAALPLPNELKAPVIALTGTVSGALLLYWKNRVNVAAKL